MGQGNALGSVCVLHLSFRGVIGAHAEYGPRVSFAWHAQDQSVACSVLGKMAVFFLFLMHRKYAASDLIFRLELCILFCSHLTKMNLLVRSLIWIHKVVENHQEVE